MDVDRPTVGFYKLPGQIPPGALAGSIAVVVDVLRATTVMVHALAAGCEAIIPCSEVEEARDRAAALPAGTALLGGERQGLPIPGFDLGNSPSAYTPAICRGKTLVMTTTNGTRAVLACREADRVLIGAFVNALALDQAILRLAGGERCFAIIDPADSAFANSIGGDLPHVRIVCAGTDGHPSEEDQDFAIYLSTRLADPWGDLSDPDRPGNPLDLFDDAEWLADRLGRGRGGRRVREIGLAGDVTDAARLGRFDLIPEWDRDSGTIRPWSGY